MRRSLQVPVCAVVLALATAACTADEQALEVDVPRPSDLPGCQDFPVDAAAELLVGELEGTEVTKAATVVSPLGPEDRTTHVIAFDVSGKAVILVHPVAEGEPATADGPYGALSTFSADATGFSDDPALAATADGPAVSAAVSCLE